MYKNKTISGRNNICGIKIHELRCAMTDVSQKHLADMLQLKGLDLDKNAIQRIESGKRFVTSVMRHFWIRMFLRMSKSFCVVISRKQI